MTSKYKDFKKLVDNSSNLAKTLQMTFPDARDAIMSLALILAGLTKSADIPLPKILMLVTAAYNDLEEFTETKHDLH